MKATIFFIYPIGYGAKETRKIKEKWNGKVRKMAQTNDEIALNFMERLLYQFQAFDTI